MNATKKRAIPCLAEPGFHVSEELTEEWRKLSDDLAIVTGIEPDFTDLIHRVATQHKAAILREELLETLAVGFEQGERPGAGDEVLPWRDRIARALTTGITCRRFNLELDNSAE